MDALERPNEVRSSYMRHAFGPAIGAVDLNQAFAAVGQIRLGSMGFYRFKQIAALIVLASAGFDFGDVEQVKSLGHGHVIV